MAVFQSWESLQHGDSWSGILTTIVGLENGDIIGSSNNGPSKRKVIIRGADSQPHGCFLVLEAKVVEVSPILVCEVGEASVITAVPVCNSNHLDAVVELCSGMGVFSSMATLGSLRVRLGIDHNPKWQELFCKLHPDADFVACEVGDIKAVKSMIERGLFHPVVIAGISCQPHSRLGDQQGMKDIRSRSLPDVLRTMWYVQCPLGILECVPEIWQNAEAQQILREFCEATGYQLTQQVLHLSDFMPTRRSRWFAVLASPAMGFLSIPPLPKAMSPLCIADIMPFALTLPQSDLSQLQLSLYELSKYHEFAAGGIEHQMLDFSGVLPTVLHSAANQLYPCRCGCHNGFSLARLQKKGLIGVLLPLNEVIIHNNVEMQVCRFLHPNEMFVLHGGIVPDNWGNDLRLALSGIGQAVAPMQSAWIFAQVKRHLNQFLRKPDVLPAKIFEQYVDKFYDAASTVFPSQPTQVSADMPREPQQVTIRDLATESVISFRVVGDTTVAHFKEAQMNLANVQGSFGLSEQIEDMVVDDNGYGVDDQMTLTSASGLQIGYPPNQVVEQNLPCPCQEWENVTKRDEAANQPLDNLHPVSPTVPYTVIEETKEPKIEWEKLSAKRLMEFVAPRIVDDHEIDALSQTSLSKNIRFKVLQTQGDVWADDEIRFQLSKICREGPADQNLEIWDPLLLSTVVQHGKFALLDNKIAAITSTTTILSAVVIDKHWFPVIWRFDSDQVWAFTCGHTSGFSIAINKLHAYVCGKKGVPITPVRYHCLPFFADSYCGAIAVMYIEHLVWGSPVSATYKDLKARHLVFREAFKSSLHIFSSRPWIWGRGDQALRGQTAALLKEHGVAESDANDRAKQVLERLGEGDVLKAFKTKQPWKELKWLASNAVPMLQLIKPSELETLIQQRSEGGKPVGSRSQKRAKGKGKGKLTSQTDVAIDPAVLRLETGVFICAGNPLSQIPLMQVGPTASGIVLCTPSEADPFIRAGKKISSGALAFVVVNAQCVPSATSMLAERIRVPVMRVANSEPALIDGLLFQFGAQMVSRQVAQQRFEIISIDTTVAKLMIFRDQVDVPWTNIVAHPLKHLFSKLPILQACQAHGCDGDCPAWHPGDDTSLTDPILELWGKQWISHTFVQTAPDKSDAFTVHVRVPIELQLALQASSGNAGIFIEPKEVDGKSPATEYQVFWMPRATLRELLHVKQTTEGIIGLARLGTKLRLRCHVSKAEEVHSALRPTGSYLPQGRKLNFLLGPLPFGTLKSNVVKIVEAIGWAARPLQPITAAAHVAGVMWRVQAVESPPQTIISTDQGDLLITRVDEPSRQTKPTSTVVAGAPTLNLVTSSMQAVPAGVDPLQVNDPWEIGVRQGAAQFNKGQFKTTDPVEVLETRVINAVMAKLPKPSMEVDGGVGVDQYQMKVAELETKVNHLHDQQPRCMPSCVSKARPRMQKSCRCNPRVLG